MKTRTIRFKFGRSPVGLKLFAVCVLFSFFACSTPVDGNRLLDSSRDLLSIRIGTDIQFSEISGNNIFVYVCASSSETFLPITFKSSGSYVLVGSNFQISGVTRSDFKNSVRLTVVAADSTTRDYEIYVFGLGYYGYDSSRWTYLFTSETSYLGMVFQAGDYFPGVPTWNDITTYGLITKFHYSLIH